MKYHIVETKAGDRMLEIYAHEIKGIISDGDKDLTVLMSGGSVTMSFRSEDDRNTQREQYRQFMQQNIAGWGEENERDRARKDASLVMQKHIVDLTAGK